MAVERRLGWGVLVSVLVGVVLVAVLGYLWYGRGVGREAGQGAGSLEALLGPELARVAAERKTWDLDFRPWIGREAGDLMVTGLDGEEIRLSALRGKEVAVVFWATWCPACNAEIPHLVELRKAVGPERLEILAVSNESAEVLLPFVEAKGINYTVATVGEDVAEPFAGVTGIPTTFFIDERGVIKLAAVGLVPFEQSLAIVNAGG